MLRLSLMHGLCDCTLLARCMAHAGESRRIDSVQTTDAYSMMNAVLPSVKIAWTVLMWRGWLDRA